MPSESAELYYRLVEEKIALGKQLEHADSLDNAQFCKMMSRLSHLETVLRNLHAGKVDVNETFDEHRDDFEAPSITSSVERFNMSPERRADGRPMESISRRVSPQARGRLPSRSPGLPYKDTPAGKMKETMFPDDYVTDASITHTLDMKQASSPTTWSVTPAADSPRPPNRSNPRHPPTIPARQTPAGNNGTHGIYNPAYRNHHGSGGAPAED